MTAQHRFELPAALEPYRDMLEKSARPSIHITAQEGTTSLHQSKFGGHPYLPLTAEHPKDETGKLMMLLAQINFAELPPLDLLPKTGILQFYIPFGDDLYGLNFDDQTSQTNFRTVFYPEVEADETKLVTDFGYLKEFDPDMQPLAGDYQLSFDVAHEPISMNDYRFEELTSGAINMEAEVEVDGETTDMWDVCSEGLSGSGHKIGGYPFFTQEDPRDEEDGFNILLLQIDTDDENNIMWGDAGVANIFIREEDLQNLNFSNVLYNWDCS